MTNFVPISQSIYDDILLNNRFSPDIHRLEDYYPQLSHDGRSMILKMNLYLKQHGKMKYLVALSVEEAERLGQNLLNAVAYAKFSSEFPQGR